jgi:hypothetical protein
VKVVPENHRGTSVQKSLVFSYKDLLSFLEVDFFFSKINPLLPFGSVVLSFSLFLNSVAHLFFFLDLQLPFVFLLFFGFFFSSSTLSILSSSPPSPSPFLSSWSFLSFLFPLLLLQDVGCYWRSSEAKSVLSDRCYGFRSSHVFHLRTSLHLPRSRGEFLLFFSFTLHPSSFILHPSSLLFLPSSFLLHLLLLVCLLLVLVLVLVPVLFLSSSTKQKIAGIDVQKYYNYFRDISVMIFLGFGFLMTFIRRGSFR